MRYGFGTRKRATPSAVVLPESCSAEVVTRNAEWVAAISWTHAIVVHRAMVSTSCGRATTYLLILSISSRSRAAVATASG